MDTCRATFLTTDPEDCDGWTQQVVDWNKKCRGAKSGHLGHLFESQKVSERRIKELANIEKLEVAEITLQEARAQASEIVCARWLDDVLREQRRKIERKSDSRNELKNIHLRVLLLQIHRAPAAVRAAVPVPVPAAV